MKTKHSAKGTKGGDQGQQKRKKKMTQMIYDFMIPKLLMLFNVVSEFYLMCNVNHKFLIFSMRLEFSVHVNLVLKLYHIEYIKNLGAILYIGLKFKESYCTN